MRAKTIARTVAQVVAAEAGGKTHKDRLSAMKDVFSAIVNRAQQTGETIQSIVSGRKQFDAYSKQMPPGTAGLVGLAKQAMAEVEQSGPTHNGTYYARSYATKNLPKGLEAIHKAVDDHVYYSDPKNRGIITAAGAKRPNTLPDLPRELASVPQSRPVGGIMAKAAPALADTAFASRFAAQTPGLLGKPADAYSVNGVDVAESPAAIDQMSRAQMAQAVTPSAPPSITPNMAQATPAQRMGDTFGLPGLNDYDRSQVAQASARFDPSAVKASGLARLGPPATAVASAPTVNDPFGNMKPGGIMAKADAPKFQESLAQEQSPTAISQAPQPEQTTAPTQDVAGLLGADFAKGFAPGGLRGLAPPANPAIANMAPDVAPDLAAPTDVPDYNVADVPAAAPDTMPDQQTIGDYPAAPEQSWAERHPNTVATAKSMAKMGLLGGPVGMAIGAAGGLLGNRLGPGFDAAVPSGDRFSVGSGLPGIMGAMGGARGATANSLSNPGMSYTSLGGNLGGLRRSDKFGWTEHVAPDGSVVGIQYDNPDKKGLLGKMNSRVGGLLGGKGGRSVSPGAQRSIDSGGGGLY